VGSSQCRGRVLTMAWLPAAVWVHVWRVRCLLVSHSRRGTLRPRSLSLYFNDLMVSPELYGGIGSKTDLIFGVDVLNNVFVFSLGRSAPPRPHSRLRSSANVADNASPAACPACRRSQVTTPKYRPSTAMVPVALPAVRCCLNVLCSVVRPRGLCRGAYAFVRVRLGPFDGTPGAADGR
jgi:hypothetical protein